MNTPLPLLVIRPSRRLNSLYVFLTGAQKDHEEIQQIYPEHEDQISLLDQLVAKFGDLYGEPDCSMS